MNDSITIKGKVMKCKNVTKGIGEACSMVERIDVPKELEFDVNYNLYQMNGTFHEAMNKITQDIQQKKTDIILEKLEELGIDYDIEKDSKSRFKSIMCVSDNAPYASETYYYNDGSPDGLRIVTFTENKQDFSSKSDMSYSLNYF